MNKKAQLRKLAALIYECVLEAEDPEFKVTREQVESLLVEAFERAEHAGELKGKEPTSQSGRLH